MPSSNSAPTIPTASGAPAEAATKPHNRIADESAEHIEGAVREIDDAHDAEDQGQPDPEKEQQRRL
jgi:hypothetical protein